MTERYTKVCSVCDILLTEEFFDRLVKCAICHECVCKTCTYDRVAPKCLYCKIIDGSDLYPAETNRVSTLDVIPE